MADGAALIRPTLSAILEHAFASPDRKAIPRVMMSNRWRASTFQVLYAIFCGFMLLCGGTAWPEPLSEVQTISFPGSPSAPSNTVITDHHNGITYEASLIADPDDRGRPIVVNLIFRRSGTASGAQNLVEPAGNWHGTEPFSMVANDVKNGVSSVFGLHRRLPIHGRDASLSMTIEDVQVTGCTMSTGCSFSHVSVAISLLPPGYVVPREAQ